LYYSIGALQKSNPELAESLTKMADRNAKRMEENEMQDKK